MQELKTRSGASQADQPRPTKAMIERCKADLTAYVENRHSQMALLSEAKQAIAGLQKAESSDYEQYIKNQKAIANKMETIRKKLKDEAHTWSGLNLLKPDPRHTTTLDAIRWPNHELWGAPYDHQWVTGHGSIDLGGRACEIATDDTGGNESAGVGLGVDFYSTDYRPRVEVSAVGHWNYSTYIHHPWFSGDGNAQLDTRISLYDHADNFWQHSFGHTPSFDTSNSGGDSGLLIVSSPLDFFSTFYTLPNRWYTVWFWQHGHVYKGSLGSQAVVNFFVANFDV
ncbi:MAG: hypothetical protein JSS72_03745 [Armatimonadetes bacterium]|nr:hypothetical protein [Armatimonadota bacterium]